MEKYLPFTQNEIIEIINRGMLEGEELVYDIDQKEISYSAYNEEVKWIPQLFIDRILVGIFDVFATNKNLKYGSDETNGSFLADLYEDETGDIDID